MSEGVGCGHCIFCDPGVYCMCMVAGWLVGLFQREKKHAIMIHRSFERENFSRARKARTNLHTMKGKIMHSTGEFGVLGFEL